ncbi:MAG TPA: hypothetical protein VIY86_00605, partial [Pirellulaceae bacterium]
EHPEEDHLRLRHLLIRLTETLSRRLARQGWGATEICCELHLRDQRREQLRVGLFEPSVDAERFDQLLAVPLAACQLSAPVVHITLEATATAEHRATQTALWRDISGASAGTARRALAQLVEVLSGRLGREAVVGIQWLADQQPERAFQYVPLTGSPHLPAIRTGAVAIPRGRGAESHHLRRGDDRPLTLEPEPRALRVRTDPVGGWPQSCQFADQYLEVRCHWGPERIETAWWRGAAVQRDYYHVEDQQGGRFWIFRDLRSGQWFQHGDAS